MIDEKKSKMYIYHIMYTLYGDGKMGKKVVVDLERLWDRIQEKMRDYLVRYNSFDDDYYLGKAGGMMYILDIIRNEFPEVKEK